LENNAESYSSPHFWVNRISQNVKQKVSVAGIANLQGQKNSKCMKVGKGAIIPCAFELFRIGKLRIEYGTFILL